MFICTYTVYTYIKKLSIWKIRNTGNRERKTFALIKNDEEVSKKNTVSFEMQKNYVIYILNVSVFGTYTQNISHVKYSCKISKC